MLLARARPHPATLVQALAALAAALAYLGVGEVRAWAATGVPSMSSAWPDMDPEVRSWVVSLPPLGAMGGSALSSCTLTYSRKGSLLLSGLMFLVSFTLVGVAHPASSLPLVLAGRALGGVGVGLAVPSAAIYIAEISSPQLRGKLSSLPATGQALGVLASYMAGIYLPWHTLAWVCTAPVLLLLLSMLFLPETPPHLARKGRREAAVKALAWLRVEAREKVEEEVDRMASPPTTPGEQGGSSGLLTWPTIHPLLLSCYLHLLQNWCGVNVIVFKTVSVFESVGTSLDAGLCTAVVGGTQLLATAASILLVDRAGRRPLLLASCALTGLAMASLATFLQVGEAVPASLSWLPLASIVTAFLGYSIGLATLPYVLMGELLPARTRSLTGAFSSTFNLVCLFLILKFYSRLVSLVGLAGVYWAFTAVCLSGVPFVCLFVPETRGRSLQEIEEGFQGKARAGK